MQPPSKKAKACSHRVASPTIICGSTATRSKLPWKRPPGMTPSATPTRSNPTQAASRLVVAVGGNPDWIAADLVAQAEHDPDARAILLTPSMTLARSVVTAVGARLNSHETARESIRSHGVAIVTNDLTEAIEIANRIAPEHAVCETESVARRLTRAGTVFVGPFAAQAAGDYATGSNHVLPTAGAAAFRGGLSASDFVRINTVQRLTRRGLHRIGVVGRWCSAPLHRSGSYLSGSYWR